MFAIGLSARGDGSAVRGDAVIRGRAGDSDIVIRTTSRLAGAIDSLTWRGKEFIDSFDHGRQLQTAWNGNAGVQPIQAETFNPTEAGSRDDDRGAKTTSHLLEIHASGNTLETLSQPAFWLKPGEKSEGNLARNKSIISDDRLLKRVVIGYKNLPHAIDYRVTLSIPAAEHNTECVIEALTGYMPPDFNRFWTFDPATARLEPLSYGPGPVLHPVVFSTAGGKFAMGAFSPGADSPRDGNGPEYGRWNFPDARVVKWNCVYHVAAPQGMAGDYHYRIFVAVGTLEEVRTTLVALTSEFGVK